MLSALLGQPKEGFLMSNLVDFDPWLKRPNAEQSAPRGGSLVCRHRVSVACADFEEAVLLSREGGTIEFWVGTSDGQGQLSFGRVARVENSGEEADEARALVDSLFRARVGFVSPDGLIEPGLLAQNDYDAIVGKISEDLRRNADQAEAAQGSPIVRRARWLGLAPEPAGTSPDHWSARCPQTSHRLMISTSTNQFGCGWCKRSGGPGELRRFAAERKAALKRRRAACSQS
jgi:hypothetical protein